MHGCKVITRKIFLLTIITCEAHQSWIAWRLAKEYFALIMTERWMCIHASLREHLQKRPIRGWCWWPPCHQSPWTQGARLLLPLQPITIKELKRWSRCFIEFKGVKRKAREEMVINLDSWHWVRNQRDTWHRDNAYLYQGVIITKAPPLQRGVNTYTLRERDRPAESSKRVLTTAEKDNQIERTELQENSKINVLRCIGEWKDRMLPQQSHHQQK